MLRASLAKVVLLCGICAAAPAAADHGGGAVRMTYVDSAYLSFTSDQRPLFLDLRTPEQFALGHIPGARSLPLEDLSRRFGEVLREVPVVLYCECHGRDLERAYEIFAANGYQNVSVMPGGFAEWARRGYPVER